MSKVVYTYLCEVGSLQLRESGTIRWSSGKETSGHLAHVVIASYIAAQQALVHAQIKNISELESRLAAADAALEKADELAEILCVSLDACEWATITKKGGDALNAYDAARARMRGK